MKYRGPEAIDRYRADEPGAWIAVPCGHCGINVQALVVACAVDVDNLPHIAQWLQCSNCGNGMYVNSWGHLFPRRSFLPSVEGLPEDVRAAFSEACKCLEVSAFTACELLCRKILMHVAVDKGAKEGDSFKAYIDYLSAEGYVTPPMRPWVTLIRDHGNRSTHDLATPTQERAEGTLMFTAELLRLIYEMDYMARKYTCSKQTT